MDEPHENSDLISIRENEAQINHSQTDALESQMDVSPLSVHGTRRRTQNVDHSLSRKLHVLKSPSYGISPMSHTFQSPEPQPR
jgi:hypothetical protein